jgi:glycosyltransferase involved in cell wall biosynthesis
MAQRVSVVIPAYNEGKGVGSVVEQVLGTLRGAGIECEVIVVDDGSADDTAEAAERAGALVLRHGSNRGYGAALKTGILAGQYELIAITDADGTYPIGRLPELVQAAASADMVVGARTGEKVHIPLVRKPAKWLLNALANHVTDTTIPDLNSGMRVFWRSAALQYFNILPDQFSFTATITISMLCDRYAVRFVPIDYHKRTGRSKIVPWDAGTFLILILRTAVLFKPLRVFLPVAMLFLTYGLAKGTVDLVRDHFISASATLAMLGFIQIFLMGMIADAVATRLNRAGGEFYSGIHSGGRVEETRSRTVSARTQTPAETERE